MSEDRKMKVFFVEGKQTASGLILPFHDTVNQEPIKVQKEQPRKAVEPLDNLDFALMGNLIELLQRVQVTKNTTEETKYESVIEDKTRAKANETLRNLLERIDIAIKSRS